MRLFRTRQNKKEQPARPTIFHYYENESSGITEFRRLARNIRYRGNPSEIKSFLVTSAMKGEGKSFIAARLAIATAKRESDKKVLLMDCDLRRPVIHKLFGIKRRPGLSSFITERRGMNEVIYGTELDNLSLIPSGRLTNSPVELLIRAKDVFDECKNKFDIVICDSPPVVPVDDVGIIAPYVDGVLMVVLAGKTDKMVVKRATEILIDAKAKILGSALNNFHGRLPYYYDYRYYRYGYDYGNEGKEVQNENINGDV